MTSKKTMPSHHAAKKQVPSKGSRPRGAGTQARTQSKPLAAAEGNKKSERIGLLALGNQLFSPKLVAKAGVDVVFMGEDYELCTYYRFHQTKLIFFLAAMRAYAKELEAAGIEVVYQPLARSAQRYEQHLVAWAKQAKVSRLLLWEIEDAWFRRRIEAAVADSGIDSQTLPSPMFLTSTEQFKSYLAGHKRPFMKTFYQAQRQRLQVMLTTDGQPRGGKWSFDEDNRQPLPAKVVPPGAPVLPAAEATAEVAKLVAKAFADHPKVPPTAADEAEQRAKRKGAKTAAYIDQHGGTHCWLPVTRKAAKAWFKTFLEQRFAQFGPFEDALSKRDDILFHSVLSPLLNVGLLASKEVLDEALEYAEAHNIPLSSLEGFVRQVIGWREFIRGIDRHFGHEQAKRNHFDHKRRLSDAWYEGTTGIEPLDDVIHKVRRLAWAHHIERLMVVGNLMLLAEIRPKDAYAWFMEMFADSSDWVMGPNVYGMAIFSDGGIFATKPYICGANYLRKMGGYKKGPWCDAVDGLYWRFVQRHAKQFGSNPRLQMMVRAANNLSDQRKETIFPAADAALKRLTR